MIKKWCGYFLFLIILPFAVQAQLQGRARIDSLLQAMLKSGENKERVTVLIELSKAYHNINSDTGIVYGNSALKLSEELQLKFECARANSAIGQNYAARTDNATALGYYIKALTIFEELKDSSKIAILNGLIGNVYLSLGKYNEALDYSLKDLNYNKSHNNSKLIAENLGNIGVIYEQMKDDKSALTYYNDAIKMDEELNDSADIAKNQSNLAGLYYKQNNFAKALELANKAMLTYEALGDKNSMALSYSNIGEIYVGTVEYGEKNGIIPSPDKEVNLQKAIKYLTNAVTLSDEIGYLEGLKEAYSHLKEAYTLKQDYKTALKYFLKYSDIKDSINSTENKIKVANVESARQIDNQNKNIEIIKLRNQRTTIYYTIGIILLVIAIVVVARYAVAELQSNQKLAKERKKHIERIRVQKTVLKDIAYIQSHEVRGPVSTILGLTQLFNYDDPADATNLELMEGISTVAKRLDKIVTEVVNKENNLNNAADLESDKEDNI